MSESLISIGSYAAATGLNPSTLRYYADAGLLTPDRVDDRTGYRYYSASTIGRARLVARLREASAPLELLRAVLDRPGHEAADLLDRWADDRRAEGRAVEATCQAVAGDLRHPGPERFTARADSAELVVALTAAARCTDRSAPLDRVTVSAADGRHLVVMASDRFRFSHHRLVGSEVLSGRCQSSLAVQDVERASDWLRAATSEVGLELMEGTVHLVDGERRLSLSSFDDALPDPHVVIPRLATAHRATVVRPDWRNAVGRRPRHDVVRVDVAADELRIGDQRVGRTVRPVPATRLWFTAELVERAVDLLPGDELIMEWHSDRRPVRWGSPAVPGWRVAVMPARPDTDLG